MLQKIKSNAVLLLLAVCAVNPWLAVFALAFSGSVALGTSYTIMAPQTASGIVTAAPNDREQAWAKKIILGAYNSTAFSDNMIGPEGSGKAFIDCTDIRKIRGNSIVLTNAFQLGGEGAQGETERNGKEEKITPEDQILKVGRQWYGMGVTTIAQAETIIGSEWDRLNSPMLEQRVGLKKSNDMQMVLRESATSDNRLYPNGKSLTTLNSSDTFGTSVITKASNTLSGNGATPMSISKDAKRGNVEAYVFAGAQNGLTSLWSDSTYLLSQQHALAGGKEALFSGRFSDWLGNYIVQLQFRLRGTKGSVGAPLERKAFLGVAIAANDTSVNSGVITGGGVTTESGYKYFEHFSGYAYTLTNGLAPDAAGTTQAGSTLTGDGTGPWYVAMIDKTTGKYALFSYTANTGTTLTGVKRLGSSATSNMVTTLTGSTYMTYNTNAYAAASNPVTTLAGGNALGLIVASTAVAQGSLIVEVNANATPFADTFGLGEMAGVCGYGVVPGAGNVFGKRTQQIGDHEKDVAVGYEFSFGCKAYTNPDNVPVNYVRITHAIQTDGLPVVGT